LLNTQSLELATRCVPEKEIFPLPMSDGNVPAIILFAALKFPPIVTSGEVIPWLKILNIPSQLSICH